MENDKRTSRISFIWLIIGLIVILLTSFVQSLIQTNVYNVEVTDLRDATNSGTVTQKLADGSTTEVTLNGKVVSGLLFKPKDATSDNQKPAVVLTHGYLNNRELQLPFAIELSRRGFVVLAVDREGHGNYNNSGTQNALMATNGMYDSVKYLYNLDYVDKTQIGISGHSMGGFTTAYTLMQDNADSLVSTIKVNGETVGAYGLGLIKAGLMQGWSSFMGAGSNVSVGMLKAKDDEFFFNSTDSSGNPTICREYLQSTGAAKFVGVTYEEGGTIDIKNGGKYVNGVYINFSFGDYVSRPFRVIYEADEIHPLNHWSIPSTNNLVDFFYAAFGNPGSEIIDGYNQVWWVKEIFSFVGMLVLISLIFPFVGLMLNTPLFASLKSRRRKNISESGLETWTWKRFTKEDLDKEKVSLKSFLNNLLYLIPPFVSALFAGFSLKYFVNDWTDKFFPNTELFPQDTTNWVALWSAACGIVCVAVVLVSYLIKYLVRYVKMKKEKEVEELHNPFEAARISSFGNAVKTVSLALLTVVCLYLVVFINWQIFVVDFRVWTLQIKVFNVLELLPTTFRYLGFFAVFYILQGIGNQTYRVKEMPEWLTIVINAFFNIAGIALVVGIQYGAFKSTGSLWQSDMALGYIVVFPILPILIFATIISRVLYKRTGNVYLGSLINAMLFTMMTCAGTASSFAYIFG